MKALKTQPSQELLDQFLERSKTKTQAGMILVPIGFGDSENPLKNYFNMEDIYSDIIGYYTSGWEGSLDDTVFYLEESVWHEYFDNYTCKPTVQEEVKKIHASNYGIIEVLMTTLENLPENISWMIKGELNGKLKAFLQIQKTLEETFSFLQIQKTLEETFSFLQK